LVNIFTIKKIFIAKFSLVLLEKKRSKRIFSSTNSDHQNLWRL